jgi:hypothetical protein
MVHKNNTDQPIWHKNKHTDNRTYITLDVDGARARDFSVTQSPI